MNAISSVADILAIESEPQAPSPCSTYAMIRESALRTPDAPALTFVSNVEDPIPAEVLTYRALLAGIHATANFFHELGVGKDDVIAFVLPNLPQTHLTLWGGQAAGIVFPINPMLQASAIADLMNAARVKVLVTLDPLLGGELWSQLAATLDKVPTLQHLVLVGATPSSAQALDLVQANISGSMQVHEFRAAIQRQPTDRLLGGRQIQANDLSSYFCTGGTTGAPKIAMHTHGNEVANAVSTTQMIGEGMQPGKNIFCGLPLFHVNAVIVTGLAPFSRGAHVILGTPQGYRGPGVLSHFWTLVEQHRINFFSAVPTIYSALLQQPIKGHDLSSLEYGLCGAAPLPTELMRQFQDCTGLKILEGYGLTEGTCVSTCNPPLGERRSGSIGIRLPFQRIKPVLLDDSGKYLRDCAAGEAGVLVIQGPNVIPGYKSEAHNQGLWVELGDHQQWLNTGDMGLQDADGYFYLTGRKKELIIRGGHNIDPAAIEGPLLKHPAVQMSAAVGRPDAYAGELPVAYVQLKPGATATEADLLEFANRNIGERAAVPKLIRIVNALPLTSVGKIFKPTLKLQEIEDGIRCALSEAGIKAHELRAIADPAVGTRLDLTLDRSEQYVAEKLLGCFPFQYTMHFA
ncbi:MAG: acyl-CoA synthetase [Burkholderiaceae bacterium]|nr:acyl-CoA synthetase [Burkholderiaceae bacterium]